MTGSPAPVRRSPLEGARGHGAPVAAEAPVTLAEIGPLDKLVARGIGSPATGGRVVDSGTASTWHLDPDEAIVLFPPGETAALQRVIAGARTTVDVGSGYAVLRLARRAARAVLEEVCPADLADRTVPDRSIVHAAVANVRVILARTDDDGQPGFTLLVARDEARYLWDALTEIGAAHGLVHAGGGS